MSKTIRRFAEISWIRNRGSNLLLPTDRVQLPSKGQCGSRSIRRHEKFKGFQNSSNCRINGSAQWSFARRAGPHGRGVVGDDGVLAGWHIHNDKADIWLVACSRPVMFNTLACNTAVAARTCRSSSTSAAAHCGFCGSHLLKALARQCGASASWSARPYSASLAHQRPRPGDRSRNSSRSLRAVGRKCRKLLG